jgi:hypothetical protein
MGIIYSAAKTNKPEAWEIGKNYYRLQDLFPPSAFDVNADFHELMKQADDIPLPIRMLGSIIKPPVRMEPGKDNPFVLTELYPTLEDFIHKAEELKGDKFTVFELPHWQEFYKWAGNDPIVVIGDIEEWAYDHEVHAWVCGNLADYKFMDSWNGEPVRKMNVHEECEEDPS